VESVVLSFVDRLIWFGVVTANKELLHVETVIRQLIGSRLQYLSQSVAVGSLLLGAPVSFAGVLIERFPKVGLSKNLTTSLFSLISPRNRNQCTLISFLPHKLIENLCIP
jgi:hypothetical protein